MQSTEALLSNSMSVSQPTNEAWSNFSAVRAFTDRIATPLSAEDCAIQSMPDVSPTRWHLAHTTWFFETFVLSTLPGYDSFDVSFEYLFNSYYNTVGQQFPRAKRGLLSRPGLDRVRAYRQHVDSHMQGLLARSEELSGRLKEIITLGLQHEQQHQELMLTDIKHVLSCNPLYPAYQQAALNHRHGGSCDAIPSSWIPFAERIHEVGHAGSGFCFDNELPQHRTLVLDFELQDRLVTCGEYLNFISDGGYRRPELWLSLGWQTAQEQGWDAPLYWRQQGEWQQFTLAGLQPLALNEPVCHISYFEADAFARWAGARLPTEFEWEAACAGVAVDGTFADGLLGDGRVCHPCAVESMGADAASRPAQMFGDVWEWTSSSYGPYPGYRPVEGALGEYNGKFMCNQYVLRGGSCATSQSHIRSTYRNFFPPEARWQFSGLRLARSAGAR